MHAALGGLVEGPRGGDNLVFIWLHCSSVKEDSMSRYNGKIGVSLSKVKEVVWQRQLGLRVVAML